MQLFLQIGLGIFLGILGVVFIVLAIRSLNPGTLNKRLTQYVEAPLEDGSARKNTVRLQPSILMP